MRNKIICILVWILILSITSISSISALKIKATNNNSAPYPPEITAPDSSPAKRWFNVYCIVTDPDGDNIYYRTQLKTSIGWLEPSGWVGPFESGDEQYSMIKSSVEQEITIGFQAKDTHNAESEWSYADITITKTKEIIINLPEQKTLDISVYRQENDELIPASRATVYIETYPVIIPDFGLTNENGHLVFNPIVFVGEDIRITAYHEWYGANSTTHTVTAEDPDRIYFNIILDPAKTKIKSRIPNIQDFQLPYFIQKILHILKLKSLFF